MGVLLDGPGALVDLGYVVIVLGLGAFAWVIRLVGEAIARHDVAASWDGVLAVGAHDLLSATSVEEVDEGIEAVLVRLDDRAHRASRGLLEVPRAADLVPDAPLETDDELTADLHRRRHARCSAARRGTGASRRTVATGSTSASPPR